MLDRIISVVVQKLSEKSKLFIIRITSQIPYRNVYKLLDLVVFIPSLYIIISNKNEMFSSNIGNIPHGQNTERKKERKKLYDIIGGVR